MMPATADATRQPKGSYPKAAIPEPMSHLPSGGCARLTRSVIPHADSVPYTYQHAS